jgi:hypothetical protein
MAERNLHHLTGHDRPTAFYDPPTSSGMARMAASIGSSRYPSLGGPATPSVVPTTVFITSAAETLTEAQICGGAAGGERPRVHPWGPGHPRAPIAG